MKASNCLLLISILIILVSSIICQYIEPTYSYLEKQERKLIHTVACLQGAYPRYYNETSKRYELLQKRAENCGVNEISRLCRIAYKKMACGHDLKEEINGDDDPSGVVYGNTKQRKYKPTGMFLKKFKCEDPLGFPDWELHRNNTPEAWGDRLVIAEDEDPITGKEWLKHVENECGGHPIAYYYEGFCGELQNRHFEITFSCNRPKQEFPELKDPELEEAEASLHDNQFEILDKYGLLVQKKANAKRDNDMKTVELLNQKLRNLLEQAHSLVRRVHKMRAQNVNPGKTAEMIFSPTHTRIHSLLKTKEYYKARIHKFGLQRSKDLLKLAARRLEGATEKTSSLGTLVKYNIEEVESKFMDTYFPEVFDEMRLYYIEYCRNNTLGIDREFMVFLEQPQADVIIGGLYDEIFSENAIDRKYIRCDDSNYGGFIVALLIVAAVAVITVYRLRLHERFMPEKHRLEMTIYYNKADDDSEEGESCCIRAVENVYAMEPSSSNGYGDEESLGYVEM